MVTVYAFITRVGNSYWQELRSTRPGNSNYEKIQRCSLEKKVHAGSLIRTSLKLILPVCTLPVDFAWAFTVVKNCHP